MSKDHPKDPKDRKVVQMNPSVQDLNKDLGEPDRVNLTVEYFPERKLFRVQLTPYNLSRTVQIGPPTSLVMDGESLLGLAKELIRSVYMVELGDEDPTEGAKPS